MKYKWRILEGDSLPNEKNLEDLEKQNWSLHQIVIHNDTIYMYLKQPHVIIH